jgi:hypothetical protein
MRAAWPIGVLLATALGACQPELRGSASSGPPGQVAKARDTGEGAANGPAPASVSPIAAHSTAPPDAPPAAPTAASAPVDPPAAIRRPGAATPLDFAPLPAEARQVAWNGLSVMQRIGDAGDFRSMGFATRKDLDRATAGPPIPVFNVPLDRLQGYRRGQNPRGLLIRSSETVYAILLDGRLKSSVGVVTDGHGARLYSVGDTRTVALVAPFWRGATGKEFIARVPSIGAVFLGRQLPNGRILLINASDDPGLELPAGVPMRLERVLDRLVVVARAHQPFTGEFPSPPPS